MKIRREYSIALLILGGIALLVFGVNYLKGMDLFQKRNVYHVVYQDISGVTEATPVFFNGFKVGQVIRRELMPNGSGNIAVTFQLDEDRLLLPEGTKVRIYSADLFSRALMLILGPGPAEVSQGDTLIGDAQLSLTDAVSGQIDPLKKKAESMFSSVDSVLTALNLILNDTTRGDINASFSSIRHTLESFDKTAERLDKLMASEAISIHATLENLRKVSENLAASNANISNILQNVDTITSTMANGQIEKVLHDLSASSAQLKNIMDQLNSGEGTLGLLIKDDSLYNNLRSASSELDMLMEDLRLNPNRYVHLSLFGKKDRLPKLSDSDIDRIQKGLQKEEIK